MTSPVSMPAGHEIVAADLDAYENLTGAWGSYTPTWTAATSNPAIGNGSFTASYIQVGKLVIYRGQIAMGSTTTFGTGAWRVSLPVAAQSATGYTGGAWAFDSSTGNGWALAAAMNNTTTLTFPITTGGFVASTSPITWATGDSLNWTIVYQAG